ncbi:MAG: hypothetical protein IJ228_14140 [Succinivibrio sp.]|nr:hypothetical protein [Succinivibrio sp.]
MVGRAQKQLSKDEAKKRPADKYFFQVGNNYVIPGTSIKGMLRNVMEMMSQSQLNPVSDKVIFWRNITGGSSNDRGRGRNTGRNQPESENTKLYKSHFGSKALGGYLKKNGSEYSLFTSGKEIVHADSKPKVKQGEDGLYWTCAIPHPGVTDRNGRSVSFHHGYKFDPVDQCRHELEVDARTARYFIGQMSDAAKKMWRDEEKKLSRGGARVFYTVQGGNPDLIEYLGTARYFRIPYQHTPRDLTLEQGRIKGSFVEDNDFVLNLFGLVGKNKSKEDVTRRGRIAVGQCVLKGKPWKNPGGDEGFNAILNGPKPSCVQHYLRQQVAGDVTWNGKNDLDVLNNYDYDKQKYQEYARSGRSSGLTREEYSRGRLRGFKYYWHRDHMECWNELNDKYEEERKKAGQLDRRGNKQESNFSTWSCLHPLEEGAAGSFEIRVDRLSKAELGAVLEALLLGELPGGAHYHRMGMGRPLGLGAVEIKISDVRVNRGRQLYGSLIGRGTSSLSMSDEEMKDCRLQFYKEVLKTAGFKEDDLNSLDFEQARQKFLRTEWMRALSAMSNFDRKPDYEATVYMGIKFDKKYPDRPLFKDRPILPDAVQVVNG